MRTPRIGATMTIRNDRLFVRSSFFALALCLAPTGAACGGDTDPPADEDLDDDSPLAEGPGAFAPDFRTNGQFFTLMAGPVAGASPHGSAQIWYSTNVRELLDNGPATYTVPVGTVAIKTGDMDSDGNVDALTVMVKQEAGFDSENNDWLYEMRMPTGEVMNDEMSGMPMSGAIEMCITCHSSAASSDYLAGTQLR